MDDVSIVALGDISPGDHYFSMGHGTGAKSRNEGLDAVFCDVRHLINDGDICLVNLEGPLSNHSNQDHDPVESSVFRGHPRVAANLAAAGVSIAHIANNHILQHGEQAFHDTIDALSQAGITPLGLRNTSGECYSLPVYQHVKGVKLALLGYSDITERYLENQELYASAELDRMRTDVAYCQQHADEVIVSLHFGDEGVDLPSPEAIAIATELSSAGVKLVIGHHSHVFQPIVKLRETLVAYSLGDAVFDLFWDNLLTESAIVKFSFNPQDKHWTHQLRPIVFGKNYRLRELTGNRQKQFIARIERATQDIKTLDTLAYKKLFDTDLASTQRRSALRKTAYILTNLWRGDVKKKGLFLSRKILGLLG